MDGIPDKGLLFFCRQSQQGFLRLASNRQIFGSDALSLAEAWLAYDAALRDSRVGYLEEPDDIEIRWRGLTQARSFSPKVWKDAYLAAFAIESELELVTFDRGFSQYSALKLRVLS